MAKKLCKEIRNILKVHAVCYRAFNWYGDSSISEQQQIGYFRFILDAKKACKEYGESCEWEECDLYIKRWANGKCYGKRVYGTDTKWYLQYEYDEQTYEIKKIGE